MDVHDHRVVLARIEVARVDEESLHVEPVAAPVNARGLAPGRGYTGIDVRDLRPVTDRPDPDLRRRAQRLAYECDGRSIGSRRNDWKTSRPSGGDCFIRRPQCSHGT